MILSSAAARTKFCVDCGQDKPETEFRLRRRNSDKRHSQCRYCYNKYMRQWVRPNAIPALCDRMFRRFGGVDGLCAEWTDAIKAARAARPGSKMVLDSFRAIFRLMELAQAEEEKKDPCVEAMSDEELERTIGDYVREKLDQWDAAAE